VHFGKVIRVVLSIKKFVNSLFQYVLVVCLRSVDFVPSLCWVNKESVNYELHSVCYSKMFNTCVNSLMNLYRES